MTHSTGYVRRYHETHRALEAAVREPDPSSPQVRADMAIRQIEDAVITLHELGPYWVDYQRAARASGDLREIALTAMRARS
jgi:hypothetical protein